MLDPSLNELSPAHGEDVLGQHVRAPSCQGSAPRGSVGSNRNHDSAKADLGTVTQHHTAPDLDSAEKAQLRVPNELPKIADLGRVSPGCCSVGTACSLCTLAPAPPLPLPWKLYGRSDPADPAYSFRTVGNQLLPRPRIKQGQFHTHMPLIPVLRGRGKRIF